MKFQASSITIINEHYHNHVPNSHLKIPNVMQLQLNTNKKKSMPMEMFVIASANETNISNNHLSFKHLYGNLSSGAVAGCVVEAALYPIDTIKTRLQAMTKGGIKALFKGGGLGKLYSGLLGNLAGVGPATGLFFAVYEPVKIESSKYISKELSPFLAATSAAIVSSLIRVPTEVVKQRMQTGQFKSAFKAISSITKYEGVKGLFAGYGAFLLRDLPFDAIEFVGYELLKSSYKSTIKREINAPEAAILGSIAGAITGFLTTPFDVLKTRMMTQGLEGQYKNLFDCTYKILTNEGLSAMFKGWQPRLIWISIGGCIFFTALEQSKKCFLPKESKSE